MLCLVALQAAPAAAEPIEERIEKQFAFGMAVMHHGYLDDAINAFHAILAEVPDRHPVRLELARTFYLKGDDGLARRHFERVLVAHDVPAQVKRNVRDILAVIRARKKWTLDFGIAFAPTTNITNESGQDTIDIFGLPFTRNAGGKVESGIGLKSWFSGDYQEPAGECMNLRTGARPSRTEYLGGRFDRMTLNTYVGPRWLVEKRTDASLLLVADLGKCGARDSQVYVIASLNLRRRSNDILCQHYRNTVARTAAVSVRRTRGDSAMRAS